MINKIIREVIRLEYKIQCRFYNIIYKKHSIKF